MLLVLAVVLEVAFIIMCRLEDYEFVWCIGLVGMIINAVPLILAVVLAIKAPISAPADRMANEQRYAAIIYQVESGMYDNLTENGKRELAEQVREWNEDLARYKALQRNIWVGVFVPNIYDDFEYIPINKLS